MSGPSTIARDRILGKIRSGLARGQDMSQDSARRLTVQRRLGHPPRGIVPERSLLPHVQLVETFAERMIAQRATVERVPALEQVPARIAEFLRGQNLPALLRLGDDALLNALPWSSESTLTLEHGRAQGLDTAGLSHALVGAAETGTLALISGRANPTTINFLPDTHIVLVEAKDIAGPFEEAWVRLRSQFGARQMPRTVNWVSGPSRTADIEQTMVQGAHGPRRLHVVIVG